MFNIVFNIRPLGNIVLSEAMKLLSRYVTFIFMKCYIVAIRIYGSIPYYENEVSFFSDLKCLEQN